MQCGESRSCRGAEENVPPVWFGVMILQSWTARCTVADILVLGYGDCMRMACSGTC